MPNNRRCQLKIAEVRATLHPVPVSVPLLDQPMVTSIVFVSVETDKGIVGYGLTRGSQRSGIREFINRQAAAFLRGKNPLESERVWHQL